MLNEKERTSNGQAKFVCDRCKAELISKTRKAIYTREGKGTPKKRWDLCSSCFAKLCRGIEKGGKLNGKS